MIGKCKFCRFWNLFSKTYIKQDGEFDCCAHWHEAYHKWQNYGDRIKDCFVEKDLFDLYDTL